MASRLLFALVLLSATCCTLVYTYNVQRHHMAMSSSDRYRDAVALVRKVAASSTLALLLAAPVAMARPEGVNRPDLLPKGDKTTVIDTANFLTKGQEKKAAATIAELEKATGYKLRLLCQSYPETPGLAIKEYWGVDDNTVVLVADKGEGFNRKGIPTNIINLNIGKNVDDVLPGQFWSRLGNKLGNQPYVKANGADIAVLNAVEAISYCLTTKECKDLPFNL